MRYYGELANLFYYEDLFLSFFSLLSISLSNHLWHAYKVETIELAGTVSNLYNTELEQDKITREKEKALYSCQYRTSFSNRNRSIRWNRSQVCFIAYYTSTTYSLSV